MAAMVSNWCAGRTETEPCATFAHKIQKEEEEIKANET